MSTIDVTETVNDYISQNDWRVRENANSGFSLSGLHNNISGKAIANFWFDEILPPEAGELHREGKIHIHDSGVLGPYCSGWDLKEFLERGLQGSPGKIESGPPKHFRSACSQMVNHLCLLSSEWAGAQAYNNTDTLLAPYIRNDNLTFEEVKQSIQEMVFSLNVSSRSGFQSPFTNLSLDVVVPEDMRDEVVFIAGEEMPYTYGDLQDEVDIFNLAFAEVMFEGGKNGEPLTFPIPTYSITKDFPWDSPVAEKIFEMAAKHGNPYFQNYIGSNLDPGSVRSMCPLTSDTSVLVRASDGKIRVDHIGRIYATSQKGATYEVWTPHGWAAAKPVQVPMTDVYTITLSNGSTVRMGENHLQPVRNRGTISAKDISVGDWIPYSKRPVVSSSLGTASLGFAVGAYLGDGSRSHKGIIYSLSSLVDMDTLEALKMFWEDLGFPTKVSPAKNNVTFLHIKSNSYDVISKYISGDSALTKDVTSRVYDMSSSFRYGLIEGFRATDGSKLKKRLYTSSYALANSLLRIFSSLGEKARIGFTDVRDGRLGSNPNYRVDYTSRTRYSSFFDEDDTFNYYMVTGVENIGKLPNQSLYCFEVDTEDHLFSLADGLVTHNCRLQLDLTQLERRGGGGLFGSANKTGSLGVVTINLANLGYTNKGNKKKLFKELDHLISVSERTLEKKREYLEELMDAGLFPYSKFYLGDFHNHFNTIGVNGANEMVRNFTGDTENITTEKGQEIVLEVVHFIRERLLEIQQDTGHMYNLEYTPAEGATYRFAKEDISRYPDIILAGTKEKPYYTNSVLVPVYYTEDVFEVLEYNDELQSLATGGTVLHVYSGDSIKSGEQAALLIRKICENYKSPYLSITPTFVTCGSCGYAAGKHEVCPECGGPVQVWERVMGYLRPVHSWNIGKQREHFDRTYFNVVEEVLV